MMSRVARQRVITLVKGDKSYGFAHLTLVGGEVVIEI